MPWMERAREVLSWSEWLRHRLAAGGTKPSSLAGVYVTAVAVIAMPHSPGIWCSSGSRPCLLLCPPCCETCSLLWLPAPVAGSHSEESGWPTFVCPYPISQLWQLCVWRHKSVCVCGCACVSLDWKSLMLAKPLALSRLALYLRNPVGISLFWNSFCVWLRGGQYVACIHFPVDGAGSGSFTCSRASRLDGVSPTAMSATCYKTKRWLKVLSGWC